MVVDQILIHINYPVLDILKFKSTYTFSD